MAWWNDPQRMPDAGDVPDEVVDGSAPEYTVVIASWRDQEELQRELGQLGEVRFLGPGRAIESPVDG